MHKEAIARVMCRCHSFSQRTVLWPASCGRSLPRVTQVKRASPSQ